MLTAIPYSCEHIYGLHTLKIKNMLLLSFKNSHT